MAEVLAGTRQWHIAQGDVRDVLRQMPDGSVQCVVTSPPYWGLRDYGVDGQIGMESTPESYVETMVAVFREVRRVLRADGTCWVNIGDAHWGSGKGRGAAVSIGSKQESNVGSLLYHGTDGPPPATLGKHTTLKPKDLCLIPSRVALALQDDGWWVRAEIVWAKKSCMPDSVTDRPTRSTERIYLLTKSQRYFYDQDAVREPHAPASLSRYEYGLHSKYANGADYGGTKNNAICDTERMGDYVNPGGRNMRDFWLLGPESFAGAHFATYPTEIPRRCIAAGTSEHGCCAACGAPWAREVSPTPEYAAHLGRDWSAPEQDEAEGRGHFTNPDGTRSTQRPVKRSAKSLTAAYLTTGWRASCRCEAAVVPCVALDPFSGSGTTVVQALRMGRRALGIELSAEYVALSERRIVGDAPLFNAQEG